MVVVMVMVRDMVSDMVRVEPGTRSSIMDGQAYWDRDQGTDWHEHMIPSILATARRCLGLGGFINMGNRIEQGVQASVGSIVILPLLFERSSSSE